VIRVLETPNFEVVGAKAVTFPKKERTRRKAAASRFIVFDCSIVGNVAMAYNRQDADGQVIQYTAKSFVFDISSIGSICQHV